MSGLVLLAAVSLTIGAVLTWAGSGEPWSIVGRLERGDELIAWPFASAVAAGVLLVLRMGMLVLPPVPFVLAAVVVVAGVVASTGCGRPE